MSRTPCRSKGKGSNVGKSASPRDSVEFCLGHYGHTMCSDSNAGLLWRSQPWATARCATVRRDCQSLSPIRTVLVRRPRAARAARISCGALSVSPSVRSRFETLTNFFSEMIEDPLAFVSVHQPTVNGVDVGQPVTPFAQVDFPALKSDTSRRRS